MLTLSACVSSCSSKHEDGADLLVAIERPTTPELGELLVDTDGKYVYRFPADPSQPERRGALSAEQWGAVRRATTAEAKAALSSCAAQDFDRCANERAGYVITLSNTGCWVAEDVRASRAAATHFETLTAALESVASEVGD